MNRQRAKASSTPSIVRSGSGDTYQARQRGENARTSEIVIQIAEGLDPAGGYVLVNALEARSLFSRTALNGKRVLEVGCGTLPVTLTLPNATQLRQFAATDVDYPILAAARRLDARPQFVVMSALSPAIKERSIDIIVLNQVLHHLSPESDILGILRHLLAPGGRLVMMEPNVSCGPGQMLKWILRQLFDMSMEASPYGQFHRDKIASLIKRGGLRVEEEWFASVLAFPLTGGQGRVRILPDSRALFRVLTAIDEGLSRLLHHVPPIARFLHWRVLYLLSYDGGESIRGEDAAEGSP